jgi:Na+-transporting NADH:ubiquinone oxidoreductase subunit NqrD
MTPTSNTSPNSLRLIGSIIVIAILVGIAVFLFVYAFCFRKKALKETDTHSYVMLSQDNKQT